MSCPFYWCPWSYSMYLHHHNPTDNLGHMEQKICCLNKKKPLIYGSQRSSVIARIDLYVFTLSEFQWLGLFSRINKAFPLSFLVLGENIVTHQSKYVYKIFRIYCFNWTMRQKQGKKRFFLEHVWKKVNWKPFLVSINC